MTGKIVGIGWAKTGTTSLGECLRTFGHRHVSYRPELIEHLAAGDAAPVLSILAEHDSAEDWPWLLLYREIDEAFPGSKFILTTRDPDAWVRSYRNMVAGQAVDPAHEKRREVVYGFDPRHASDEKLVARVAEHDGAVRAYFHDRPQDLLEVDWSRGDGWAELCAFLDVPVPDRPFPHVNAGSYSASGNLVRRTVGRARSVAARVLR